MLRVERVLISSTQRNEISFRILGWPPWYQLKSNSMVMNKNINTPEVYFCADPVDHRLSSSVGHFLKGL